LLLKVPHVVRLGAAGVDVARGRCLLRVSDTRWRVEVPRGFAVV
jgi:hypothetical protein